MAEDSQEREDDSESASPQDGNEDGQEDSGEGAIGDEAEADDAAADDADDAAGDAESEVDVAPAVDSKPAPEASAPKRSSRLWWLLPIAVVVEFWAYGRNGYIEVCVGKTGETDFALVGQERTDDNRWKFPRCETRLNLGLRSEYDARVEEATKVACRGATLFNNRGEATQCEGAQSGWERRVDGRFCPPWDPNYYEHLFWFLK